MTNTNINVSLYLLRKDDAPAVAKTSELSPSTWWVDVGPVTIFCRDQAHAEAVVEALNLGLVTQTELDAERAIQNHADRTHGMQDEIVEI
jgi:hypothetical protein